MKQKRREGTPEKGSNSTPNVSQEIATSNEATKSGAIFNEEIEKLAISEEQLLELRQAALIKVESNNVLKEVVVQKLKPESERNRPKSKNVKVMKHAPSDARVRPIEFSGGARLDAQNNIIPHSILGEVDDFLKEAANHGQLQHLALASSRQSTVLSVKYERKDQSFDPFLQPDNALANWFNKMSERKKQQGYISKLVQKAPNDLIMNRADNIRDVMEEQHLIDRTIPLLDNGKGYRVGSEFWKQQEFIGDEMKGIHMTLTYTEKGYPPVIEHIGTPAFVKAEKNVRPASASSTNHPWNKSSYLQERKRQLRPFMEYLDPHQPDFSGLQVVGKKLGEDETNAINRLDLSQESVTTIEDSNESAPEDVGTKQLHMTGPSLLFAGQPVTWSGDSFSNIGQMEMEARVTFECNATQRVMSLLEITNNGTTSIYYEWKNLPVTNPFDIINAKVQRFYFNTSSGVILPSDTMKVPFIFKSPNAGIFTEQWQFETNPVLCGGAALVVTLRGAALQEDHYQEDRNEIEAELRYRQAAQIVSQILDKLVDGIKTPDRPSSPIDTYITDMEVFARHNPNLIYHYQVVESLKSLYLDLFAEEERTWREWDSCVETISDIVMKKDEDEDAQREDWLQKLNTEIVALSYPHFTPIQQRMYTIGMELLSNAVDTVVDQSNRLRKTMGLPGRDQDDFTDDTSDGKRGKAHEQAKKASSKETKSTKEVKSPDKKGGKDSKAKSSKTPSQTKSSVRTEESTPSAAVNSSGSLTDGSKTYLEGNLLEALYKNKLYSLTYVVLSSYVSRMADLFDDVHIT